MRLPWPYWAAISAVYPYSYNDLAYYCCDSNVLAGCLHGDGYSFLGITSHHRAIPAGDSFSLHRRRYSSTPERGSGVGADLMLFLWDITNRNILIACQNGGLGAGGYLRDVSREKRPTHSGLSTLECCAVG